MSAHRITSLYTLTAAAVWLSISVHAAEPNGRLEITGDYRYKAQASEQLAEARELACREALRQAVVNSAIYREETASTVDSSLLRDVANTLATRHVQDQQIVEQNEQGRTVFCRIKAYLPEAESARAIKTQLAGKTTGAEGLDQNRVLKLLSVKEEDAGTLVVQYQTLKRLDWANTHYQGGLRDAAHIMVDFYDKDGLLLYSQRFEAWRTPAGDDVMSPGAVGLIQIPRPGAAKTYRVWLVK